MFLRFGLTIIAFLGILFSFLLSHHISRPSPIPIPNNPPASNPFEKAIVATGIVESSNGNVIIGIPQANLVMNVFVEVGTKVKEGDPLFELDDRELKAQLAVEKSNIVVQKKNLNRLQDQFERLKSVKDVRAVSQEELQTRFNDVNIAYANIEKAIHEMEKIQVFIDRLTIRAPRDGEILQSNIHKGNFLDPSDTAMILGDIMRLQVRVDIDEQNAALFHKDMKAVSFLKNNAQISIPLTFIRIEPIVIPKKSLTGSSDERVDTRVLQVIYSFEKPKDIAIYVGQRVDVFIQN